LPGTRKDDRLLEKHFQEQVRWLAKLSGDEFIYHTHDSRNSPAGFPDIIVLREGRMIVAELKREGGQPTPEQYFWLIEFLKMGNTEVYLWYPSDWDEIERVIRRRNNGS
jgi:hypothetical protein